MQFMDDETAPHYPMRTTRQIILFQVEDEFNPQFGPHLLDGLYTKIVDEVPLLGAWKRPPYGRPRFQTTLFLFLYGQPVAKSARNSETSRKLNDMSSL